VVLERTIEKRGGGGEGEREIVRGN